MDKKFLWVKSLCTLVIYLVTLPNLFIITWIKGLPRTSHKLLQLICWICFANFFLLNWLTLVRFMGLRWWCKVFSQAVFMPILEYCLLYCVTVFLLMAIFHYFNLNVLGFSWDQSLFIHGNLTVLNGVVFVLYKYSYYL